MILTSLNPLPTLAQGEKDLLGDEEGAVEKEEEFAIVFAAMGVNMETAHFFKQARSA